MVDWSQAEAQLAHLSITAEEGFFISLFPPKQRGSKQVCHNIAQKGTIDKSTIEQYLERYPDHGLGYIPNWGGTKDSEIAYCRAIFYEDDNPATDLEHKRKQWETAGLPHPSLQIWTGGKSVHNYWILDTPCSGTDFRQAQRLLFRHIIATVPGVHVDKKLCNPARVMRLAGGRHPSTGEVSRIITATGERFPFAQLLALITGAEASDISTSSVCLPGSAAEEKGEQAALETPDLSPHPPRLSGLLSSAARKSLGEALPKNTPPPRRLSFPERDLDAKAYQSFVRSQEAYDSKYKPTGLHYSAMPHDRRVSTVISALAYCPERLEPGSGTYGDAFVIYAALVNEFGAEQAISIAQQAKWSTEHWDLVEQAETIARNSEERKEPYKRIYHIFDTAEYNGWSRPWPVLRELKREQRASEDDELLKELRHSSFKLWSQSAAAHLTLDSVFHPRIATLLGGRADAFPVAHTAMIAPFMTTMAAVLGKRYRIEIKTGWREPVVFWMGTVAPASSLKTPVANQFLGPLLTLDSTDQRAYKKQAAAYKAKPKEEREDAPKLPRQRVVIDATLEGLCTLLERENIPGVVAFHDELAAFIGSMDKYRANTNSDRAHWLSMWSGGAINVVRKGTEPILVEHTCVNVFGAIQQDKLTDLLHGDDAAARSGDGFWARFLWIVPEYRFPKQNLDESDITAELHRLIDELDNGVGRNTTVRLSSDAWTLFAQTCDDWSAEADRTYASRSAFLGKLRGYLARTAALLHALDHAASHPTEALSPVVPRSVMERAVVLCRYFLAQFDVLAPQVGGGDLPHWVVRIVAYAQTTEDGIVTHRDLVIRKWASTGNEARTMLERLVTDYGVGRLIKAIRRDQIRWQLST